MQNPPNEYREQEIAQRRDKALLRTLTSPPQLHKAIRRSVSLKPRLLGLIPLAKGRFKPTQRMRASLIASAVFLIFVTVTSVSPPAIAGPSFETGNTLHANCQDAERAIFKGACYGYIIGVYDILSANPVGGISACLPESDAATAGQMIDVAVQWLTRHPEVRHLPAYGLVAQAFFEAFPCS